jgi:hypothetical protein
LNIGIGVHVFWASQKKKGLVYKPKFSERKDHNACIIYSNILWFSKWDSQGKTNYRFPTQIERVIGPYWKKWLDCTETHPPFSAIPSLSLFA